MSLYKSPPVGGPLFGFSVRSSHAEIHIVFVQVTDELVRICIYRTRTGMLGIMTESLHNCIPTSSARKNKRLCTTPEFAQGVQSVTL